MPRETEEEMFRRLTSEARREARIEQQRDFERRRQRKLQRRRKHEEEARRRAEEATAAGAKNAGLFQRKLGARGRGILAKPRKRVVGSCSRVVVGGDVVEGAVEEEWLPLTRDVGTETDPIDTCLLHNGELDDDEVGQEDDVNASCEGVVGGIEGDMCESEAVKDSAYSHGGRAEWEEAWEQAALESAEDEEQVEADRCHAAAVMFM
ncbi:hypothetical protein BST61_g10826 [Cercospora zeina]